MWAVVSGPDGTRHGDGYDKDADVYMHDPMEDPMPYAPSLKMFCVYGVDKPVERYDRCFRHEGLSCLTDPRTPEVYADERGDVRNPVQRHDAQLADVRLRCRLSLPHVYPSDRKGIRHWPLGSHRALRER